MCYKIQYETFFDAKKELRLIGKTDSRFFKNTVYQCEECGLFHHTSNKLKKQKKMNRKQSRFDKHNRIILKTLYY